ncbi:uncharacterized protein LOC112348347 isoform X2 [Selaginella moellendorffii]|uniref:uncharacterized protein LOC112348347 isoform X2 n=1 Tax=Selaginella moellendorffii TaxID=88036 RepID=UPI000D1C6076|nr:uncharacterized protein LOC112348347 isoform X2 [Selaginella moellendorffii]|eukprot:XP_024536482.1 uncharacterized protein LOC112348347 isoform X2 [Selaginella moellendorffii]
MQSHGCRDEYYAQTGTVVEAEIVCPSGESHRLHERRCVKVLEFVEQESRAEQRRREVEHEHSNLAGQLEDLLLATGKLGVRQCRATKLLEREEDAADEEQHLRSPYVPGTRAREEEEIEHHGLVVQFFASFISSRGGGGRIALPLRWTEVAKPDNSVSKGHTVHRLIRRWRLSPSKR